MLKLVISAACLCVAVQAEAAELSGQEISDLLAGGATVELDTPVGTKLPVRYGSDGKLFGEAGGLGWYLGAATDRGRWWVEAGQLCHRWSRWFSSEPQCLRLRKVGRTIHWRRDDGQTGTATLMLVAPRREPPLLASPQPGRPKLATASVAQGAPLPRLTEPPPVKSPFTAPGDALQQAPSSPGGQQPAEVAETPAAEKAPQAPVPKPAAEGGLAPPEAKAAPSGPAETTLPDRVTPPDRQTQPKRAGGRVYKVANVRSDDVLNVRSGPSADFEIVGALPPGTRGIAITSACRLQWCPVQHHAASGWVNRAYLTPEDEESPPGGGVHAFRGAPRNCLTPAARALLDRIEREFGPVQVISTCRPGATIRGTWRPSRHASGNAVDFKAGSRKAAIVAWLIANHRSGGIMTYPDMDHIHVDIGPRFVSIAGGPRWASWRGGVPPGPR